MLRLAVLMVACAAVFAKPGFLLGKDEEWELFKKQYNKIYGAEEPMRRKNWEENINFINAHNLRAANGEHSYTLGMNHLGDMTNAEINQLLNGYVAGQREAAPTFMKPLNAADLPTTVDWRTKGYVTPVKDQKQCGSCWAFSTTGSLEGQHFRSTGNLVSLSEQNLVDCSRPEGNMGCGGGLMDQAFRYIKLNNGIDTEVSYPYEARDDKCRFNRNTVGATDRSYVDIKRDSEDDLQQAVANVGPVSVAIDASRTTFHFYKSGVYNDAECSSIRLDHGVLAVGYGTEGENDYWLVKNSWNTTWGMEGYIMMSRNKNNQCGIATAASYPLV